jgi:hypothetical protein
MLFGFFIVGFAGEDNLHAPDTETGTPNIRLGSNVRIVVHFAHMSNQHVLSASLYAAGAGT